MPTESRAMKRPRAENLQNIPVVPTPVEAKDPPIFHLPTPIGHRYPRL